MDANIIIDRLGGTSKVAALCGLTKSAISQWRRTGIPKAWERLLRIQNPDAFMEAPEGGPASDAEPAATPAHEPPPCEPAPTHVLPLPGGEFATPEMRTGLDRRGEDRRHGDRRQPGHDRRHDGNERREGAGQ